MKLTTEYLDSKNINYTIDDAGKITVGGSLYFRGTGITAFPENLTVGGSLNLEGTGITALPENLTVGGSLYLRGTGITALPDNLTVGGYLYLNGTGITALPDNLIVGGYIDIRGTSITALPENLTVGGSLYLRGTGITSLPDNLTVGGVLHLRGTGIKQPKNRKQLPEGFLASVQMSIEIKFNAKGFTIADGILARILQSKSGLKKIIIVGKRTASWLASDDKGNHAHGQTAREAVQELAFKSGDRDVSEFKNMPKDTLKTPEEWGFIYRMITGACQLGTKHFMESKGVLKESYTLAEIIDQTKGAYGSEKFRSVVL